MKSIMKSFEFVSKLKKTLCLCAPPPNIWGIFFIPVIYPLCYAHFFHYWSCFKVGDHPQSAKSLLNVVNLCSVGEVTSTKVPYFLHREQRSSVTSTRAGQGGLRKNLTLDLFLPIKVKVKIVFVLLHVFCFISYVIIYDCIQDVT